MTTLLTTKLYSPLARPNLVLRPRLLKRLNEGLRGPLTLIAAPAGYGKTTLMVDWHAGQSRDMPVAWQSLDKNDNQVGRFLNYLIAALHSVDNRIGSEAAQLVAGMQ